MDGESTGRRAEHKVHEAIEIEISEGGGAAPASAKSVDGMEWRAIGAIRRSSLLDEIGARTTASVHKVSEGAIGGTHQQIGVAVAVNVEEHWLAVAGKGANARERVDIARIVEEEWREHWR